VALRQRAKFEGWLKVELGALLESKGVSVRLEETLPLTSSRADIRADFVPGEPTFIMLKTVNTNYRFTGVESLTRPITKNIAGVVEDLSKLRAGVEGPSILVVFPVFPLHADDEARRIAWELHEARLLAEGELRASGFVRPPCSGGEWGVGWFVLGVRL
jgi:hypothetical protein